jgi:hypothetical protein
VSQVFRERPKYRKNRKKRAASYQMIGPDQGGAMWTICISERKDQRGLWRVITGWSAEQHEKLWYRRS